MMRKIFTIILAPVLILSLLAIPAVAGPPWVTDKAEYGQIKVAQVPLPWQFWAVTTDEATGITTVTDKIRISPTWVTGPPPLPPGAPVMGEILVRRQWATLSNTDADGNPTPIPLEALVWEPGGTTPGGPLPKRPDINWELDSDWQLFTQTGMPPDSFFDVTVDILLPDDHNVVLVAYEVGTRQDTTLEPEIQGHFINEAFIQRSDDNLEAQIVQVFVNFDVQNNWGAGVTDFELDFAGLKIKPDDITWALGYVKGTNEPWGANGENPLVVRPIPGGTEIKWVEPCRPLALGEIIHLGLSFKLDPWITGTNAAGINATVQGYWTQVRPKVWCVEGVNPSGKNVPPAGWSTLPGRKGGRNDDGFYQLFYRIPPCWPTPDDPIDPSDATIWVGTKELGPLFGPYDKGVVVKITEAPGAKPTEKKIGSKKGKAKAVVSHITLPADPMIFLCVKDADDNLKVIARCGKCLVPPPPK
ncbi:hypothetical protein ACFLYL_03840 [Chloroflexota bacterium]